jgi:hypothetical protein
MKHLKICKCFFDNQRVKRSMHDSRELDKPFGETLRILRLW